MLLSALPLPLCYIKPVCASVSLALKGYKFWHESAQIRKRFHVTFSRFNGEIKHIFSQHNAFVSFT